MAPAQRKTKRMSARATKRQQGARADVLLHPVRLRIVQTVAALRQATVSELDEALPDVPAPSLYRHIKLLEQAGLLEVVSQRRVRGGTERTYALDASGGNLSAEEVAHANADTHGRWFLTFALGLHDKLTRVLRGAEASEAGIDLVRDGIGYHSQPMWLSDDEFSAFAAELNEVVQRYAHHTPAAGRRLRSFSTVLMPDPDVPPAADE